MSHNFIVANTDTDSIMFSNPDGTHFSLDQRILLIDELNRLMPDLIRFEDDGYFEKVIILKAKNYILYDGKKTKIKGSALKCSTKEPALKAMVNEFIEAMLHDATHSDLQDIYTRYALEAYDVQDIKKWVSRKTISSKTMESERANETKIMDAVEGRGYVEGDRVYLFFRPDGSLCTSDEFDGNYDKKAMLKKVYNTVETFETILPVKELFPNYSLKKNLGKLEEIQHAYEIELCDNIIDTEGYDDWTRDPIDKYEIPW